MPLDNRLACIAKMVKPSALVADIGTDHGFLVCELVKNGTCTRGIAADINPKPLHKAKLEIARLELGESIETICTDGLHGIDNRVESVVIAGMGGELIASIIDSWPHSRSAEKRFYLQPMTKAEKLREWLWESGFEVVRECCCKAAGKAYTILESVYIGEKIDYSPIDLWIGRVEPAESPEAMAYCKRVLSRLEKQRDGMAHGRHNPEELGSLQQLCEEIQRRMER